MAISTYKTFLMTSTDGSEWTKLIDIKDFPDLGGEPESIETTTLSDRMQTYIPGIQSLDAMQFTTNYTKADYDTLSKKTEEAYYAVWFGGTESGETVTPTGSDGKYKFKGSMSVYVKGGGTNEAVEMTLSITPSTPIVADAQ